MKSITPTLKIFKENDKHVIMCEYTPITPEQYNQIMARAVIPGYFGKIRFDTAFKKYLTGIGVSQQVVESATHLVIKNKIMKSYRRIDNLIHKILGEYNAGADILALSKRYDFPPSLLMYNIMFHMNVSGTTKYTKSQLWALFNGKSLADTIVDSRDRAQFKLALKSDLYDSISDAMRAQSAQKYEDNIVARFRAAGVSLMTQDEIAEIQKANHGRALATPDLLFRSPVVYRAPGRGGTLVDTPLRWVDVKDYCYVNGTFIDGKLVEQSDRYTAKWGRGAFLFHHGYVNNMPRFSRSQPIFLT